MGEVCPLCAVFTPGYIQELYDSIHHKHVADQACRIADVVRKHVKVHAIGGLGVPKFVMDVNEHDLYHTNVQALRNMGVRVFSYKYVWLTHTTTTKVPVCSSRIFSLVWDSECADAFDERVLKTHLFVTHKSLEIQHYDFVEIV